jgi:predicted deacylase
MARQHATEVGSSWVAHGLAQWLASPAAVTLRKTTTIYVVPIMDLDSVVRGTGGKQQRPHDHNRDWMADPHWPAVRAAQARLRVEHAAGRLAVMVDLHCSSAKERDVYFHVSGDSITTREQREARARFLSLAREAMKNPIPFRGRIARTIPRYDRRYRRIAHNWCSMKLGPTLLSLCLEVPWNTLACSPANHRLLGAQLGQTFQYYLDFKR